MNKNTLRMTLILLLVGSLWPQSLLRAQAPSPPPAARPADVQVPAGQKVKLYYMREATKLKEALNLMSKQEGSPLKGLLFANVSEDELIVYGPEDQRNQARRLLATLDLPRPGIVMEMWGVQITSRKPENMAKVMALVRREINRTQQDVRDFYSEFEKRTREATGAVNETFSHVLVDDLFYRSALNVDHPLSLADILLRLTAAQYPGQAAAYVANNLETWADAKRKQDEERMQKLGKKVKKQKVAAEDSPSFARFFRGRGLVRKAGKWESNDEVDIKANHARKALIEFAYQYGRLIHRPQSFSPYNLQQASEILNTRLQAATDALNLDIQDLFVEPTLDRIAAIVRDFDDVEYAQVGKTTVASLSGIQADVTSSAVNTFDVTPPLRLSELLKKADELTKSVTTFVPDGNAVGKMPLSEVIGLIGAFGEERSVWRELQSGITLNITPNVLRNMTSAELKIVLKTGDPQTTAPDAKSGVKPLSRVSKHDVTTSIYVEPLDFFDLSAFASQSTLEGGRGYVPIVGPVWRGLFGEVPIAGKLFSWKRDPKTVFSESLVLTTSFITPTSMGVAVLYPTELIDNQGETFAYSDAIQDCQKTSVFNYKINGKISNKDGCLIRESNQATSRR